MLAASEAQRSRLRLETAKGCHELFDLASRRDSAGLQAALKKLTSGNLRCRFEVRFSYLSGVPSRISSDARLTTSWPTAICPRIETFSPAAGPFRTSIQCARPLTDAITKVL